MFQDIKPTKRSSSKILSHQSLGMLGYQAINNTNRQPDHGQSDIKQDIEKPPIVTNGGEKGYFKRLKHWWHHLGRNQRFAIISFALLIFVAGAIGYYYFSRPSSEATLVIAKAKAKKTPTTVASPLTGLQVDPVLTKRPVTGIMIENSPDARPQSGIQEAGVVFEAIAEGGITRFMTLYQDAGP